ncbi:MAG: FtsX-like permease family protein [Candidatus Binataceae bacterium]
MRFEYLIGIRYLRARRRQRFVSMIAVISLVGVMIGTFALTVVLSVMSGFQEDLRDRLLAFNPHVTVAHTGLGAADLHALQKRIAALPGVVGVAPFISSQVMIVSTTSTGAPGYVSGGTLRGVIARNNPVLTELKSTLTTGTLDTLDQIHRVTVAENGGKRTVDLPGAIVGKSLAFDLGLRLGDPMVVISPASLGGAAGVPRLRRFVVGGFFYSGMYEFDSTLVFVSRKAGQALLANDPQLKNGLEVRVRNLFDAPAIAKQIAAMAGPGFKVSNWTLTNAPLFSALKLEKFTYFLVLLLIVLVAAFNIVATLVMVVMERRKEIAILRAMGARAGSIALIFLCEGAALGVVGTAFGVGLGFIVSFVIGKYHLIHLPPDLFMVSFVPVRLYPLNFIAVAVAAILICACGAVYPALQARSLSPVEIIRYE